MKKQLMKLLSVPVFVITGFILILINSCTDQKEKESVPVTPSNRFKEIVLPQPVIRPFVGIESKLAEVGGDSIKLSSLKSRVLLIEFTGVHCGPCQKAIDLMRQLAISYHDKSFEIISIETEDMTIDELIKYKRRKHLNYYYLKGGKDVLENFRINGVPAFFVLDENRMVRKYISGYRQDTDDRQIIEAINSLL